MLEVLAQLMEDGDYEKCVRLAEQQLLKGGVTLTELAHINFIICRCRLALNDPYGAVPSGLLASKLAKDLSEWDLLGRVLVVLSTAYVGIRNYDQALHQLYSYFEYVAHYQKALRLEGAVWKQIGIAHQRRLEGEKAIEALTNARLWFSKNRIDHGAFTTTHDLINIYLQMHEQDRAVSLEPVADLLKYEQAVARKYSSEPYYQAIFLLDRAATYMHLGRLSRAAVCAQKAIDLRSRDPWIAFHAHMLLHQCTLRSGDPKQAMSYALAARVEALQAQHYELEYLATQAMADVVQHQNVEFVRELDMEYQKMGIDLGQYLPGTMLHRAN